MMIFGVGRHRTKRCFRYEHTHMICVSVAKTTTNMPYQVQKNGMPHVVVETTLTTCRTIGRDAPAVAGRREDRGTGNTVATETRTGDQTTARAGQCRQAKATMEL